jgi:hypothetical protein
MKTGRTMTATGAQPSVLEVVGHDVGHVVITHPRRSPAGAARRRSRDGDPDGAIDAECGHDRVGAKCLGLLWTHSRNNFLTAAVSTY